MTRIGDTFRKTYEFKFRNRPGRRAPGAIFVLLALAVGAFGSTGRLVILHTNDIHDHVRPGYNGIGGLPYISGYVNQVRSERDDVLLVDAGDVVEKGDLVAYRTRGEVTYEALGRMHYDAVTIGNHDHDFGLEHLRRFEQLLRQPFICINLVKEDGSLEFTPSRVVEINGIKVGLVGLIAPRRPEFGGIDFEASGRALAVEAERLKQEVHLVVAVVHHGSGPSAEWSRMAPAVDVFVSGHHHEPLFEPLVVAETGAIIVQAGSDARWVGRLELEVDLDAKRVTGHRGGLVLMRHDLIPADREMLEWVAQKEAEFAPEAGEFVVWADQPVGRFGLGRLLAEAVRRYGDADVGLFHAAQIIRNALPPGRVDYNAVFRTAADRADPLIRVELTGAEIAAYLNALAATEREYGAWGQTQWAGFSVRIREEISGQIAYDTDLTPDRIYSVMMPEREWQRYYLGLVEQGALLGRDFIEIYPGFSFADAAAYYFRDFSARGVRLHEQLERLRNAQGDTDPDEATLEPLYLRSVDFWRYYHDPRAADRRYSGE